MKTQLLILTRFNVGMYSTNKDKRFYYNADSFTELRLELFKCATLLSIQSQTFTNFKYLFFIDCLTPQYLKDKIYELESMDNRIHVIETTSMFRNYSLPTRLYFLNTIPFIDKDTDLLIQLRIDSDDVIKINYLNMLLSTIGKYTDYLYLFSKKWMPKKFYPIGALIQLVDKTRKYDDLIGVYDYDHMQISELLPIYVTSLLEDTQINHGFNLCPRAEIKKYENNFGNNDVNFIFDKVKVEEIISKTLKLREKHENTIISVD